MPLLPDLAAYQTWATALDTHWLTLAKTAQPDDAWLLRQTAYTGPSRRQILATLPLVGTQRLADLGCGVGAAVLELAQMLPLSIDGWDVHTARLDQATARSKHDGLHDQVQFLRGDITLDGPAMLYDGAITRFVLQHLSNPQQVLRHWREHWIRPGGWLWIEEVDDGWTVEEPPLPPAWQTVLDAFRQAQAGYGGNRYIGRTLPGLLTASGWNPLQVYVQPQVFWGRQTWTDPSVQFEVARVASLRDAMREQGLSDTDYERGIATLQAHYPQTVFVTNATIRILAHRQA